MEETNFVEFVDAICALVPRLFFLNYMTEIYCLSFSAVYSCSITTVCFDTDKESKHLQDEEQVTSAMLDIVTVARLPVCLSNRKL